MERLQPANTVVLGLGNPIRSDDGVGVYALRQLELEPSVPSNVTLIEGGTKGLELVAYLCDASRLLVLDTVDVGAEPGSVFRVAEEDLRSIPGNGNVHGLALADILHALRMMGREPKEVVLLGIQPSTTELGTSLSTAVQQALPALIEGALIELSRWAGSRESSFVGKCERAEEEVASSLF